MITCPVPLFYYRAAPIPVLGFPWQQSNAEGESKTTHQQVEKQEKNYLFLFWINVARMKTVIKRRYDVMSVCTTELFECRILLSLDFLRGGGNRNVIMYRCVQVTAGTARATSSVSE